jgi:serine/threonine-protein kinase
VRLTHGGYGPTHVRTHEAELSLAREQLRDADAQVRARALARIEAIAALQRDDLASRKQHWLARAYAAEAHCRAGLAARALGELDAIERDLQQALPEGGRLPREVAAIRSACNAPANR